MTKKLASFLFLLVLLAGAQVYGDSILTDNRGATGATGAAGAAGATGAAGPNSVTSLTTSDATAVLSLSTLQGTAIGIGHAPGAVGSNSILFLNGGGINFRNTGDTQTYCGVNAQAGTS